MIGDSHYARGTFPAMIARMQSAGRVAALLAPLACAANVAEAQSPPPLEAFAMRPAVLDVDLSPSGEHVAIMRLVGPGLNYAVDVYETDDIGGEAYTLGAEHMDIVSVDWANDERLLIRTRQPVEVPGRRVAYNTAGIGNAGRVKTYAWKLLSVGLDGGEWVELPRKIGIARFASETANQRLASPRLVSRLPKEADRVMIEWLASDGVGTEFFRVNVRDGRSEPMFQISSSYFAYEFDSDGDARIRSYATSNDNDIVIQFRLKGTTRWRDWIRYDVEERRALSVLGFVPGQDNQVYVAWARDRDTEGIFQYDLADQDAVPELLFATDRYDAASVVTACISQACVNGDEDPGIVGFRYVGDAPTIYYIDEAAAALQRSIDAALPAGNFNRIHDRAADDNFIVIHSVGPREPGRYFLLTGLSEMQLLAATTAIGPEQLGERRAIRYEARDGMSIHAVLTLPPGGEPPYPAVAHPHGGPQARDALFQTSPWWADEWAQLLATRGYAVLQPNFRGSTGYGYEYFAAGDRQWGLRMQDDVDDGVQYLVDAGIADPGRVAIFGWSYGGYSALMGALRDPNPYRCAIAGAGVSDMDAIAREEWRYRFRDVIQMTRGGLSPLDLVENVSVPVLLVHGDRDLIVPMRHSDLFALELERLRKPYRYVKLIDAAHTLDTLGYEHNMQFFGALVDFLANDCGFQSEGGR